MVSCEQKRKNSIVLIARITATFIYAFCLLEKISFWLLKSIWLSTILLLSIYWKNLTYPMSNKTQSTFPFFLRICSQHDIRHDKRIWAEANILSVTISFTMGKRHYQHRYISMYLDCRSFAPVLLQILATDNIANYYILYDTWHKTQDYWFPDSNELLETNEESVQITNFRNQLQIWKITHVVCWNLAEFPKTTQYWFSRLSVIRRLI